MNYFQFDIETKVFYNYRRQLATLTVLILNQGQCDYFNQMRTLMFSQWDLLKHPKTEYVIQLIRSVITISGSHFINIV